MTIDLKKIIEKDCKNKLRNKDWSEQEKKRYVSGYTSAAKKFHAEEEYWMESAKMEREKRLDFRNIYPYCVFFRINNEGTIKLIDGTEVSILEIPPAVLKNVMHEVLTENREMALVYRFGGYNGYPMTYEQAGMLMGCVRERVRQLEAKALRTLKDPTTAEKLIAATCEVYKK